MHFLTVSDERIDLMKSLKKNILYNFIYQILVLILPFITAPYLSRVIGAGGLGTYSLSQTIAQYFTYLTLLGLTNYGNREIARVQNDKENRSRVFCEIYAMQLGCFVISCIIYAIYTVFFSVDFAAASIMWLWVISAVFDINWFFFGMEQFKLTVTRNAIIKLTTVILIFVFVKDHYDTYKYILIMAGGILASQMCLWPFVKRFIDFQKPTWQGIKKHIKPNLVLFVPVIAISVYRLMDKVMIGYMASNTELGYYENAEKITTIILTLVSAVGTVMLPRMSALISDNNNETSKKYIDITMLIVIAYVNAAIYGIFAIGDPFCTLYFGEGFERTSLILKYLVVTVTFVGCGNVLRTQYLIPHKMDRIYINSALIGAGINFTVNLILIPLLSAVGAAIGTICAEVVVFLYQSISIRKAINFKLYIRQELLFLAIGAASFGLYLLIPDSNNSIADIGIALAIGCVTFVPLTLFLLKQKGLSFPKKKRSRKKE